MTQAPPKPKRKLRRWAAIIVVLTLFAGAAVIATRQSFSSKAAKLRVGMTKAEVIALMGQPDREMKLHPLHIALYTPIPFDLHALVTRPAQTLSGNSNVPATEFPVYIEFRDDIATRILIEGQELEPANHPTPPLSPDP